MANFQPLNNYSIFILSKIIKEYNLKPPFLDIACGTGYLSKYLGLIGWSGKAVDSSKQAVNKTLSNLEDYQEILVERKDFLKLKGKFKTVFMFDILEHIRDDNFALRKVCSLLIPGGFLVIAAPSNPHEWSWDDDFYGHFRRYTEIELKQKLIKAKFKPIIFYDYSFPFFWLLRKIYTRIINKQKNLLSKAKQTEQSSFSYAWRIPYVSFILDKTSFLWLPIYIIQYKFFKNHISYGNSMIVLATKNKKQ